MNVLFVSECSKNALKETRRILDQFAERYGERTWRTCITQQGLETVSKMLRKSARKNTAVACHWLRKRDLSELLWIVGDAKKFNSQGIVPTNLSGRDIIKSNDENDWHTLTDIKIMAGIAALFHDFGKANNAFQAKLHSPQKVKDAYRHEWVSLVLFAEFVNDCNTDHEWLQRLVDCSDLDSIRTIDNIQTPSLAIYLESLKRGSPQPTRSYCPFKELTHLKLASAVAWLIVTHHFLPYKKDSSAGFTEIGNFSAEWNSPEYQGIDREKCFTFAKGLPFNSLSWCSAASNLAKSALNREQLLQKDWLQDRYSLHLARLSLMFADHYYSSQDATDNVGDRDYPLYANTKKQEFKQNEKNLNYEPIMKQRLDEHLIQVAKCTKQITRFLPQLFDGLPKLSSRAFRKRTRSRLFQWQNQAYELACNLQHKTEKQGFFGVNMASTGRGKTLANARIMYGLSNQDQGARFSVALGLRTLTLQTGAAYKERLNLTDQDVGVMIGSTAILKLAQHHKNQEGKSRDNKPTLKDSITDFGSESLASLIENEESISVFLRGNIKQ